jgi:hypothetical protein
VFFCFFCMFFVLFVFGGILCENLSLAFMALVCLISLTELHC